MERESLEQLLAAGLSLADIGRRFGRDESTVGYWVHKYGLEAVNRDKHAARGGLCRDRVEELIGSGLSLAKIAVELDVSQTTVKYWLARWDLKTRRAQARALAREAKSRGVARTELTCPRHGLTEFFLEGRGSYRCMRCRSEAVAQRRRRVKEILVEEAGGKCSVCGYRRCMQALEFHHRDPARKEFSLGHLGHTRSIAATRAEASKCVLLCANCHAEVEAGIVALGD